MPLRRENVVPREPTFELDDFGNPLEVTGPDAWIREILEIAFYENGTFSDDPDAGAEIQRQVYDTTQDSPREIKRAIINSIQSYLSDIPIEEFDVNVYYWDEKDSYVTVIQITFNWKGSLTTYAAYLSTIDDQLRYVVSQLK
jgi:hypothetical protein